MQMHGPRIAAREGPRPPLADQGQDLRGAAPGVPDDLRAAHPRARAGHPGPGAAPRRGRPATWRYTEPDWDELRTVVTNHGPMSQARLEFRRLAREETRWVRETILGRARGGSRVTDEAPRRRGRPSAPTLEPWEVFRQEKDGDPMRHGGSVMAPDAELAIHYARELYGRRQESVRLWVVRRADIARPRRPGPAPAAARPLVQEARRLRHARQARPRARDAVRPGEAEGAAHG